MGAQLQGPPHLRSHSNQQITNKQPHNYSYPARHPVILCSVGSLLTVLQGLFLSQCLPHSSHTLALLAWEAPDQHDSICLFVYKTETAVTDWKVLSELMCLNSFPDVRLLFFVGRDFWDAADGERRPCDADSKKLRSPHLLSCGV